MPTQKPARKVAEEKAPAEVAAWNAERSLPDVKRARSLLRQLVDTFDNCEFGESFSFGDLRMLINFAEDALDALNGTGKGT